MLLGTVGIAISVMHGCADAAQPVALQPAIIHLDFNGADPDLTLQFKEGIYILSDPSAQPAELARACQSSANPAHIDRAAGKAWAIVAAGPLLDSPDSAEIRSSRLNDHTFDIEIAYTNVRQQGASLRRNQPWRPLLKLPIPLALPAGHYQVQVNWQAVQSLPQGQNLNVRQSMQMAFDINAVP